MVSRRCQEQSINAHLCNSIDLEAGVQVKAKNKEIPGGLDRRLRACETPLQRGARRDRITTTRNVEGLSKLF